MTTAPGDYCARCGNKCDVTLEGGFQVYRCPNGHGIQLLVTPDPTETGILQWPIDENEIDIPLTTPPTTVIVGSIFLIDGEYMTVNDISNIDNPGVARGSFDTAVTAHEAGAAVTIWGS